MAPVGPESFRWGQNFLVPVTRQWIFLTSDSIRELVLERPWRRYSGEFMRERLLVREVSML